MSGLTPFSVGASQATMEDSASAFGLGSVLNEMLVAPDIEPGASPGYELCKQIYLAHPLGGKMVDAPIKLAQSQEREISVKEDAPDEVVEAFKREWKALKADDHIANYMRLSRIYGISVIFLGCEKVPLNDPMDLKTLWQQDIFFSELDPLNTAGSLVLNQNPVAPDFNKPSRVVAGGKIFIPRGAG